MTSHVDLHCTLKVWPRRPPQPQPLSWTLDTDTTFLLGSVGHVHKVAGLLRRRPVFDPRAVYLEFVADVMTMQEICHPVLLLSPVSILPLCFPKCAPTSSGECVDTFLYFLFEVYLFFNYRNNILLTIIAELLYVAVCLFRVTGRISN